MHRKLEEKRGVIVNEAEPVSLDVNTMALSGPPKANVKATVNGSDGSAWDADWAAPKNQRSSSSSSDRGPALPPEGPSLSPSLTSNPSAPQPSTGQQSPLSFEWPPPASTQRNPSLGITNLKFRSTNLSSENTHQGFQSPVLNGVGPSLATQAGEDFDPFANWPPRTSATSTGSTDNKRLQASWSNGTSISTNSLLSNSNHKSNNNPPLNPSDWTMPSLQQNPQQKPDDFGDFFSSNKPQEVPLKLAPPPISGLGKGRGRNPIRPIRSPQGNQPKSGSVDQPPLLDLL